MDRVEFAAGDDQKVVAYVSPDTGGPVDFNVLLTAFTREAATLARDGWRIVSTAVAPMREVGTAGNMFFQSGGGYSTQAALIVVFARDAG